MFDDDQPMTDPDRILCPDKSHARDWIAGNGRKRDRCRVPLGHSGKVVIAERLIRRRRRLRGHKSMKALWGTPRNLLQQYRTGKKPRNTLSYGAFLLEAEVGIEPAFTDLQSGA